MRVIIFTDEVAQKGGWHGAKLHAAFVARGVQVNFASLQNCLIDLSGKKPILNGFTIQDSKLNSFELPKNAPQAVFVRGIAGGTLQQITTRLNMLHMLKMLEVTVYNDGKAIERTVDKAMTSFLLQKNGVPTPKTWVCESRSQAHAIIASQAQLVIKPLFGSQGAGVRLVEPTKLPLPMDNFVDGVFYLQKKIEATHDFRVLVVNNQPVAAMRRSGVSWLHNVSQGAICAKSTEPDVLDIAVKAAKTLDIDYCGVDVIRDQDGQLFVLEVNSIPAWRGLQSVTEFNIAEVLADDLLQKLAFENR